MLSFLLQTLFTISLIPLLAHSSIGQQLQTSMKTQQAVDTVKIQQVVNLYAIAVDQHRLELLPLVFTLDVTANFSLPDGTVLHGLDAVTQELQTLQAIPSVHDQSTNYINYTSPSKACATTYNTATFFGLGNLKGQVFTNYGRYEDDLIKMSNGWRIKDRTLVNSGYTGNRSIVFPGK